MTEQKQNQEIRVINSSETVRTSDAQPRQVPQTPPPPMASMGPAAGVPPTPAPQFPQPQQQVVQQVSPELQKLQQDFAKVFQDLIGAVSDLVLAYATSDIEELHVLLKKVDGGEDILQSIKKILKIMRELQRATKRLQSTSPST